MCCCSYRCPLSRQTQSHTNIRRQKRHTTRQQSQILHWTDGQGITATSAHQAQRCKLVSSHSSTSLDFAAPLEAPGPCLASLSWSPPSRRRQSFLALTAYLSAIRARTQRQSCVCPVYLPLSSPTRTSREQVFRTSNCRRYRLTLSNHAMHVNE